MIDLTIDSGPFQKFPKLDQQLHFQPSGYQSHHQTTASRILVLWGFSFEPKSVLSPYSGVSARYSSVDLYYPVAVRKLLLAAGRVASARLLPMTGLVIVIGIVVVAGPRRTVVSV